MSSLVTTDVLRFDALVLDVAKIPPDVRLFRLGGRRDFLVVREDLAGAITGAGATGLFFEPMDRFATDRRLARRLELIG
jgi:hypothetical protein